MSLHLSKTLHMVQLARRLPVDSIRWRNRGAKEKEKTEALMDT